MLVDHVMERIAAWEAAGLIDAATADRLRLAEVDAPADSAPIASPGSAAAPESSHRRGPSSVASIFGPGVTIGEMFAYLGGAFVLGAYETFLYRPAGPDGRPFLLMATGSAVAAVALALLGMYLRNGDARRQRAAGVMFALAVLHVGAAGAALAGMANLGWPAEWVVGAAAAVAAAVGFRLLHPAVLTQLAFLASITSLALLFLTWLDMVLMPAPAFDHLGELLPQGGPDPFILLAISTAWWLALAVLIGFIGLREARTTDLDDLAGRRAALTRLWAGLVAVIGLASSVTRSTYTATGEYVRVVEPLVGELAILALAAVLVERAFRRDASTFVYAAALGLIFALTDFNFTYLSSSTEIGLLIEGVILLVAGVGADRLRRRIGRPASPEAEVAAPAASA